MVKEVYEGLRLCFYCVQGIYIARPLLQQDFVCLFVCLFGGVSKAGEIRTLPKTSLPVAVLRVAKGRIP